MLVVVGSETDSATGTWFPIGQWAGTLFEKTRDAEQRAALRTAIGNYRPYVTHHLERADLPPGETATRAATPRTENCACELPAAKVPSSDVLRSLLLAPSEPARGAEDADPGWGSTPCEPERIMGSVRLTCLPGQRRGNPFWIVRASPNVLHEHGGFFNPYFVEFARRLLLEATAGTETPEERALAGPPQARP